MCRSYITGREWIGCQLCACKGKENISCFLSRLSNSPPVPLIGCGDVRIRMRWIWRVIMYSDIVILYHEQRSPLGWCIQGEVTHIVGGSALASLRVWFILFCYLVFRAQCSSPFDPLSAISRLRLCLGRNGPRASRITFSWKRSDKAMRKNQPDRWFRALWKPRAQPQLYRLQLPSHDWYVVGQSEQAVLTIPLYPTCTDHSFVLYMYCTPSYWMILGATIGIYCKSQRPSNRMILGATIGMLIFYKHTLHVGDYQKTFTL